MDIDVTLLFQLGILLGLMFVLQPLLHAPLLQVLEARKRQTEGTASEVRHLTSLTSADQKAYDARMAEARHHAHVLRERLRQSGREQARKIEAEARAETLQNMQLHRQRIETAEREAATRLGSEQEAWAQRLASELLGRARKAP